MVGDIAIKNLIHRTMARYSWIWVVLAVSSLIVSSVHCQCFSEDDNEHQESKELVANTRTLVDGALSFGLEIYRTISATSNSDQSSTGTFFSPFSIWSALLVTYMGAKGQTEKEIEVVLGLEGLSKLSTARAYSSLWYFFQLQDSRHQTNGSYRVANRLYFQEDVPLLQCILENFSANIGRVNFAKEPEAARQQINGWVQKETNDKITDLLPPSSVTTATKMVIANAVYFQGVWLTQFDAKNNQKRPFTISPTQRVMAEMMTMRGTFLYGVSESLQSTLLELPYTGRDLSMFIILPQNRYSGLAALSRSITPRRLEEAMSRMFPAEAFIAIPKFKMEDSFELSEVLVTMGLRDLFDPGFSDLSGFTNTKDLTVDAVHHKAYIDVNEKGTEAAAATSILASRTARPAGPASFIADRPFFFFIKDNLLNVILFMGSVRRPQYQ